MRSYVRVRPCKTPTRAADPARSVVPTVSRDTQIASARPPMTILGQVGTGGERCRFAHTAAAAVFEMAILALSRHTTMNAPMVAGYNKDGVPLPPRPEQTSYCPRSVGPVTPMRSRLARIGAFVGSFEADQTPTSCALHRISRGFRPLADKGLRIRLVMCALRC